MPLIKSISGIRGTIGGSSTDGLNPLNLTLFTSAYAHWVKGEHPKQRLKVVIGRDARISGEMVSSLIVGTLLGCGIDVVNLGLATTPTVEMAVVEEQAQGGIIITASHNPRQWNALKLLNQKGEFLSDADGKRVLQIADNNEFSFPEVDGLGVLLDEYDFVDKHIEKILQLKLVDRKAIQEAGFRVAIDCVNSVGGIAIPRLLNALGVEEVIELYCDPTGEFPHNPEPLPEHLTEISSTVVDKKAHLGFVVDPDVDRLAIVCEDGSMFGEEYTLVAVADYVLSKTPGNTVSNLSSTAALRDVTQKHGGQYFASAVGEVNVVAMMKECNAVIGGEGNGGVIYPELHYGRDALVGIALFLTHLAKSKLTCSALKAQYPQYFISKNKIELLQGANPDAVLDKLKAHFINHKTNTVDGLKVDFDEGWIHLRKSNTEPIIRIYAEAKTDKKANELAKQAMDLIENL
ncbi:MAG: phosphoglucosamine mutase [Bacteroidales bacterium]|jgi:phosphomannomutase|nr:phosphoglucosamine mutase [Bacteroidales bacterium]MDD4385957.1 phosphoglucosamine mutase [Bacteroidales bacterium]MDY0197456.1 phosphoglucosamine mutase [Tenuifilaceae bacterium]